jgi:hypothetical protein
MGPIVTDEDLNEDYQEMKEFLELQSDAVQENCRVVSPSMMNCEFALHIDKNPPDHFVPRMPRSAMPSENDTCARVTVAATVIGCYIGYFRAERDIQDGSMPRPNASDTYKGGYIISRIDFQHALLPNQNLVSDALSSEEMWLVAYNTANTRFTPRPVGKIFIKEITFLQRTAHKPEVKAVMFMEHQEEQGLWLSKEHKLQPGFYRIEIHWPSIWRRSIQDAKATQAFPISEEEYIKEKNLAAAFLDRHVDALPNKPAFMSWQ